MLTKIGAHKWPKFVHLYQSCNHWKFSIINLFALEDHAIVVKNSGHEEEVQNQKIIDEQEKDEESQERTEIIISQK